MGRERDCSAIIGGKRVEGKALLETEEVIFRSANRPLRLRFAALKKIEVKSGKLHLDDVVLDLGDDSAKWADAIKNPRGRIQKLGVKAGQKVVVLGIDQESFLEELRAIGPVLMSTGRSKDFDVVFFGASATKDLAELPKLIAKLASHGALWIVRPKGVTTITESDVRAHAKGAGLVDVKVVKFSETHTAEKYVIPVSKRA
jgi:hypothetical protein